jgi:CBS domain-containing protein
MSWTVESVMTRAVVSALPVVDANGQVLGIVSEADLLLKEERPAARPAR